VDKPVEKPVNPVSGYRLSFTKYSTYQVASLFSAQKRERVPSAWQAKDLAW